MANLPVSRWPFRLGQARRRLERSLALPELRTADQARLYVLFCSNRPCC